MKKILLLIIVPLILLVSGCTVQDYKDNREQFMIDCQADAECISFVIQDADDVIKQTPSYLSLENDLLLTQNVLLTVQNELLLAQDELQEHEDRINSLEELTEEEYMKYIRTKYLDFMNNSDVCGIPSSSTLDKDEDGNYDVTITLYGKSTNCEYDDETLLILINGLHSELPNYNVTNISFTN